MRRAHVQDPSRPGTPYERIVEAARDLPRAERERLPHRWELLGDVLILKLPPGLEGSGRAVAEVYARVLRARTVMADVGGIRGNWRLPDLRRLWGDGTETVHLEDRVRFKLDVAEVMLSSGNLDERIRIARETRAGETVVDLFAGIGYFAIPIAVRSRPARVVACEVNPVAFHYLQENVRLNRAGSVEPRLGDCRDTAPRGVADRVVMGHFDASSYLDVAFAAARERATLHVHGLLRAGDPEAIAQPIREAADRHGYRVSGARTRVVKSYRPKVRHVVVDVDVERVRS